MKHIVIFLFIFVAQTQAILAELPAQYLEGRLVEDNQRYASFNYVLGLMEKRNAKTLVETGTARCEDKEFIFIGDGGSTVIFSHWASDHDAILFSVDIDLGAVENAKQVTSHYSAYTHLIHDDSINFLKNFGKQIDFLYLDAFDFDSSDPYPSQIHHYNELIAALPWLTDQSIIMIDDCKLLQGGKGKLVIEHLIQSGWKIAYDSYQVVLVKADDDKTP